MRLSHVCRSDFRSILRNRQRLSAYLRRSGSRSTLSSSKLSADRQSEFLDEIELRFNRLLIKIFAEVAWSDLVWSQNEGVLAVQLLEDLLRTKIPARDVKATLKQLLKISSEESWQAVLEPFVMLDELKDQRCVCLLYTSPSPRDGLLSRMPSSA